MLLQIYRPTLKIVSITYNINTLTNYSKHQNKSFSIVHTNISSLHKNFDSLFDFLPAFDLKPDLILCLSETKLKDFPFMNLSILYFLLFSLPLPHQILAELPFTFCPNFFLKKLTLPCLSTDQCEDLFVELSDRDEINQSVCGIVYCHPKCNLKVFTKNLKQKLLD